MFLASFKVGITTLMDALSVAAAGLENDIGGWVEIDKCSPLHRVENFGQNSPTGRFFQPAPPPKMEAPTETV